MVKQTDNGMVRIADYMTTQQAADRIGCTDSLVRRLRREGEFPGALQFGPRSFLLPRKEVEKVANAPHKTGRPRKNSA